MQNPNIPTQRWSLRAWRTTAVLLALVASFYIGLVQLSGVDFWLQAKIGEMTWYSGRIPSTLLFPFTELATEHFNAHEWLASVLFHLLLQGLGEQGMALLTGALSCVLLVLLAWLAQVHTKTPYSLALFCGLLALCVENYRHVMRPELIALVLMALFWICLERFCRTRRWRDMAVASAVTVVWANVHGSFVLAIFLGAIYVAGAGIDGWRAGRMLHNLWGPQARSLTLFTVCMALCTCVNPFGLELVSFAFRFGGANDLHQLIGEWTPTFDARMLGVRGLWIALAAWSVVLAAMLSTRDQLRSVDWLVLAFFTALACKAIRFPVFLCFLVPLYLPRALQRWAAHWIQGDGWYPMLSGCAAAILLATFQFGNASGAYTLLDATRTKFTDAMVSELKNPAHQGNVLNSMELGAELIYRAYPRLRPASDCRLDSYGLDYLLYLNAVIANENLFNEFVNRYSVKYLLLDTKVFFQFQESPMWKSGQWQVILVDEKASFIGRRS